MKGMVREMTSLKIQNDNKGQVQITDEAIAIIARTAAQEVKAVVGLSGNLTGDIAEMLGRKSPNKGITVEVEGNNVRVTISILVSLGSKIQDVAAEVQSKIKNAVETMTGLTVTEANVNVTGVIQEKK